MGAPFTGVPSEDELGPLKRLVVSTSNGPIPEPLLILTLVYDKLFE